MTFSRWFRLLRLPVALVSIPLFFIFYNRFLLDASLRTLKTSLSILDLATGVGQAEAALVLVDETLTQEMAKEELDLKALATLQYAQGALATADPERPVEDVQVMVSTLAEEETTRRGAWLNAADGMVTGLQTGIRRFVLLPRQMVRITTQEVDRKLLAQAIELERKGLLPEASTLYQELIASYPHYAGRILLKMRLGLGFQKRGELDEAERLYREVLQEATSPIEVQVAQQRMAQVAEARQVEAKARQEEERLKYLPKAERHRVAYAVGSLWIQANRLDRAAKFFAKSVEALPEGDLALPALFKESWCLRSLGKLEEAGGLLQEIIRRDPNSSWAGMAYLQMAEIYKAGGDYEGAVQAYDTAIGQTRDVTLQALTYAQAGSVSRYDLKDPERSQAYFQALAGYFPASVLSSAERQITQLAVKKRLLKEGEKAALPEGLTPSGEWRGGPTTLAGPGLLLTPGTPVMMWLEGSLVSFVELFGQELSKWMKLAGEERLLRRYSEVEFTNLLVRKVGERFSGQLSNIQAKIRPDGFVGSATVQLERLSFPAEARVQIELVRERPHVRIVELRLGKLSVPMPLVKYLEAKVNQTIEKERYPFRVREFELGEGFVSIDLELLESVR